MEYTAEELMNRLVKLSKLIEKMGNLKNRQIELSNEYNSCLQNFVEIPNKQPEPREVEETTGMSIFVGAILGIIVQFFVVNIVAIIRTIIYYSTDMMFHYNHMFLEYLLRTAIFVGIPIIIGFAIIYTLFTQINKDKIKKEHDDKYIAGVNAIIEERQQYIEQNEYWSNKSIELENAIQGCIDDMDATVKEIQNYIKGWYPSDMVFMEACKFFYTEIKNYRATNMKEAQDNFIAYKRDQRLNTKLDQVYITVDNGLSNLAQIMQNTNAKLDTVIGNQKMQISQNDAIIRTMTAGFAATNLNICMNGEAVRSQIAQNTAAINQNTNMLLADTNRIVDVRVNR